MNINNGTDQIVTILNEARAKELYAIHQYLKHKVHLEILGYGKLADEMKIIAIQEMEHADILAQRIKILGHEPTDLFDIEVIKHENPLNIFEFDSKVEANAIDDYNKFIDVCRIAKDNVTEKIISKLINDEQKHFEYFSGIKDLIVNLNQSFLAEQAKPFVSNL